MMLTFTDRLQSRNEAAPADRKLARVSARLPVAVVFTERAVAALRAFLALRGLDDYRIFHCNNLDLNDIDRHLEALGESAVWEASKPALPGGEPMVTMTYSENAAALWEPGFLQLARHGVVVARWFWLDLEGRFRSVWLCAAPSTDHFLRLRKEVLGLRHNRGRGVWQIVHGSYDAEPIPRNHARHDDLLLTPALRSRVDSDILRFFDAQVSSMYADMRVPYRRGVLLHGPPGNGKTSLIRFIGMKLPDIPCMLLRPTCGFDTDDLETVIDRWKTQAPAVLVIEDLDWLLGEVNVSRFLNMLDGVESKATGGLLLIATTNHPEKLDPAINNRPGRFDVVVEVPSPDEPLRREYFSQRLPGVDAEMIAQLAGATAGLSFAHLQEVVHVSGVIAIHAGHSQRSNDDVLRAAGAVRESHEDARRGFANKPEIPFGLGHLIAHRRSNGSSDVTA